MSLARLAIRLAAVEAIVGATAAGNEVRDSMIAALDDARGDIDATGPFVAVYTDDSEATHEGRGLIENGRTTLTFEIGVTAWMAERDEAGRELIAPDIPATDSGFEMLIDTIERQIRVALSNPANKWAEIWRLFMSGPLTVKSERGAAVVNGIRRAGRQLAITGGVLPDPVFGQTPRDGSAWSRLLAAIDGAADPNLVAKGALLRDLIGIGAPPATSWNFARSRYGLTFGEVDALGLIDPAGDVAEVLVGEITAEEAVPEGSP